MYELKDNYGVITKAKTLKKAREIAYAHAEQLHTEVEIIKDGKVIEIAMW